MVVEPHRQDESLDGTVFVVAYCLKARGNCIFVQKLIQEGCLHAYIFIYVYNRSVSEWVSQRVSEGVSFCQSARAPTSASFASYDR